MESPLANSCGIFALVLFVFRRIVWWCFYILLILFDIFYQFLLCFLLFLKVQFANLMCNFVKKLKIEHVRR